MSTLFGLHFIYLHHQSHWWINDDIYIPHPVISVAHESALLTLFMLGLLGNPQFAKPNQIQRGEDWPLGISYISSVGAWLHYDKAVPVAGLFLWNDSTRRCFPTWFGLMCNTGGYFMANSSSKHHIQSKREKKGRLPASIQKKAWENVCDGCRGRSREGGRERKRRGRIYLQMLDTSVLTKRVMWRPWRWRSLWYIAVFSVFSRTDSTFGTAEENRDLLPTNYRLMPLVHPGWAAYCGSAVDLSAIGWRKKGER